MQHLLPVFYSWLPTFFSQKELTPQLHRRYKININATTGDTSYIDPLTSRYLIVSSDKKTLVDGFLYPEVNNDIPLKNGLWTGYYRNGALKYIGQYNNDEKIGTWTVFDSMGVMHKQETYIKLKDSLFIDNNIGLTFKNQLYFRSGSYTIFHSNGQPKVKGAYKVVLKRVSRDTVYDVDTETYQSTPRVIEGDFWKPTSVKSGNWIYYNTNGEVQRLTNYRLSMNKGIMAIDPKYFELFNGF